MQDNIIKSISNVELRSRISGDLYFYNLHFTEDKIIWECIETPFTVLISPGAIRRSWRDKEMPPEERVETFEVEYWQIENVEIKQCKFKITLMRDYPILKKKHTIHFEKKDQSDVESIFMRMLPSKTIIK